MLLPTALAKQSRPGKPLKEFFFPKFSENQKLCPVFFLDLYIKRTASLRGESSQLFISFIRPHHPVTSSTIARWLKETIGAAGMILLSSKPIQSEVLVPLLWQAKSIKNVTCNATLSMSVKYGKRSCSKRDL